MPGIEKAKPAAEYPPEEGCYLRGNDYSPGIGSAHLYDPGTDETRTRRRKPAPFL